LIEIQLSGYGNLMNWGLFLPPLLAAVFTGLVSWYANQRTSSFYFGKLTQQAADHGRRLDVAESDLKDHEQRIGHLEGGRVNGVAAGRL
jgi:hypothetical protein